jgi:hypothetical protein
MQGQFVAKVCVCVFVYMDGCYELITWQSHDIAASIHAIVTHLYQQSVVLHNRSHNPLHLWLIPVVPAIKLKKTLPLNVLIANTMLSVLVGLLPTLIVVKSNKYTKWYNADECNIFILLLLQLRTWRKFKMMESSQCNLKTCDPT